MKSGSKNLKGEKEYSEMELHHWLQGVNLGRLSSHVRFERTAFPRLKPTNWEKLYRDFQKSRPVSIRLPVRLIDKLKQVSLQKGIGYQALIRMWLTEKLGESRPRG